MGARRLPGPKGWELLGMARGMASDPLQLLIDYQRRYGDLFRLPIGGKGAVVVTDPECLKRVFQGNNRNYSKRTMQWLQMSSIVGNGLLTSDGEFWRRQRKLAQPAFAKQRLAGLGDVVVRASHGMLERWLARPDPAAPLDVDMEMMEVGLEIAGGALFGIDLRTGAQEFTRAVMHALDHMVWRSTHFWAPPDAVPTPRNRRFNRAVAVIDREARRIIRQRRASGERPDDLLTMLIEARDEETGEGMDDQQLRDEVVTLLVAGHETVSASLTWAFYLLSRHPGVMRRVDAELREVLQGRPPSAGDFPRLQQLQRVVDEVLRLYPPGWLVTRLAQKEDELGGFHIPAGAMIMACPYIVHRHPGHWENPEGFDPERFVGGARTEGRHAFAYLPFGGGPRLCIGDRFARFEATLLLATVLQHHRLHLRSSHVVEPAPHATVRPRYGMPMTLHRVPACDDERRRAETRAASL